MEPGRVRGVMKRKRLNKGRKRSLSPSLLMKNHMKNTLTASFIAEMPLLKSHR
jgi:hypothetical protein